MNLYSFNERICACLLFNLNIHLILDNIYTFFYQSKYSGQQKLETDWISENLAPKGGGGTYI